MRGQEAVRKVIGDSIASADDGDLIAEDSGRSTRAPCKADSWRPVVQIPVGDRTGARLDWKSRIPDCSFGITLARDSDIGGESREIRRNFIANPEIQGDSRRGAKIVLE